MTTGSGDRPPTDGGQETLMTAAFDALPAQVAVLDGDGTILVTNRAWEEFGVEGGLPEADMVGENYLAVCDAAEGDESARTAAEGIRAVVAGERAEFSFEYPCHSPEERRWFTMRAIRLSGFGEPRVLVMHLNITERKEAELRVEAHNETLETVAGVLSHDLRNPLNVALARADLLAADPDPDPSAVADGAAAIVRSLRRMTDIVEDALVLAREADADAVEPVEFDRAARRAWSTVATGDATLEIASTATVEADESLLVQLLENLFRNSIDHADTDAAVTVGLVDSGFFVADDGPGIPDGERDRVFETGYTTNAAGGGTGLGLSIVRRIGDAHDWTVRAVDPEGTGDGPASGARFEVTGVTVLD